MGSRGPHLRHRPRCESFVLLGYTSACRAQGTFRSCAHAVFCAPHKDRPSRQAKSTSTCYESVCGVRLEHFRICRSMEVGEPLATVNINIAGAETPYCGQASAAGRSCIICGSYTAQIGSGNAQANGHGVRCFYQHKDCSRACYASYNKSLGCSS